MGNWYIVHASAGSENRVASELAAQFEKAGLDELLHEVLVPKKMISGMRRGVRIQTEDRVLPGYVLVRMDCTPETIHTIRRIPRVIGMLGADSSGMPKPLSQEEVDRLLNQLESITKPTYQQLHFDPGEIVRVSDGLFSSMEGVVEEVDNNRLRLKVSIAILGRPTPVDLEFSQVEKVI